MSREIRFRVYDNLKKVMITKENLNEIINKFDDYEEANAPYFRSEWYPAVSIKSLFDYFDKIQYYKPFFDDTNDIENRFEIMEYTGLKDKNGQWIFEGDILKNDITDSKCVVKFYDTRFMLAYPNGLEEVEMHSFLHRIPTMFEVIGNIYDNPELIKK